MPTFSNILYLWVKLKPNRYISITFAKYSFQNLSQKQKIRVATVLAIGDGFYTSSGTGTKKKEAMEDAIRNLFFTRKDVFNLGKLIEKYIDEQKIKEKIDLDPTLVSKVERLNLMPEKMTAYKKRDLDLKVDLDLSLDDLIKKYNILEKPTYDIDFEDTNLEKLDNKELDQELIDYFKSKIDIIDPN